MGRLPSASPPQCGPPERTEETRPLPPPSPARGSQGPGRRPDWTEGPPPRTRESGKRAPSSLFPRSPAISHRDRPQGTPERRGPTEPRNNTRPPAPPCRTEALLPRPARRSGTKQDPQVLVPAVQPVPPAKERDQKDHDADRPIRELALESFVCLEMMVVTMSSKSP